MSSVPSYVFSGLDSSTQELQRELEALGGGDSRMRPIELHAVIDDLRGREQSKILWQLENFIGLRDPNSPSSASANSMSYFPTVTSRTISELLSKNPAKPCYEDIAQWVLDGFNMCIIADGPRHAGKTLTVFGPRGDDHSSVSRFPKSLVRRTLECMFSQRRDLGLEQTMSIGVSCWALRRSKVTDQVIDLCDSKDHWKPYSGSISRGVKSFTIIDCIDCGTALRVIQTARSLCEGVEAVSMSTKKHVRDSVRAHFFLRITVFLANDDAVASGRTDEGRVSHAHFVDLIGPSAVEGREFSVLADEDREARREVFLQHKALAKVLQEMKQLSSSARQSDTVAARPLASPSFSKITSARDSKLTMMLAPLIQGNVRTSILLFLRDTESQFKACKNALWAYKDVGEVVSACYRENCVDRKSLGMKHPNIVLPPLPQHFDNENSQVHTIDSHFDGRRSISAHLIDALDGDCEIVPSKSRANSRGGGNKDSAGTVNSVDHLMGEFNDLMASIDLEVAVPLKVGSGGDEVNRIVSRRDISVREEESDVLDKTNIGNVFDDAEEVDGDGLGSVFSGDSLQEFDDADADEDISARHMAGSPDLSTDDELGFSPVGTRRRHRARSRTRTSSSGHQEWVTDVQSRSSSPELKPTPLKSRNASFYTQITSDPQRVDTINPGNNSVVLPEVFDGEPSLLALAAEPVTEVSYSYNYSSATTTSVIFGDIVDTDSNVSVKIADHQTAKEESSPDFISHFDPGSVPRQSVRGPETELRPRFESSERGASLSKEADASQLKRANECLLEALYIEKKERERLETKLLASKDDLRELETKKDLEFDEYRVEIIRLKSKLRQLSGEKSINDIFLSFEDDVKRLSNENDSLRKSNILLEEKCTALEFGELPIAASSKRRATNSDPNDLSCGIEARALGHGNVNSLRTKLRNVSRENVSLKSENEMLRKKIRQGMLSDRLTSENLNRISMLNAEYKKIQRALEAEQEAGHRRERELLLLRDHRARLEDSEEQLKSERARLMKTVETLQKQLTQTTEEMKNLNKLNRFIEKHAAPKSAAPGNQSINANDLFRTNNNSKTANSKIRGGKSSQGQGVSMDPKNASSVTTRADSTGVSHPEVKAPHRSNSPLGTRSAFKKLMSLESGHDHIPEYDKTVSTYSQRLTPSSTKFGMVARSSEEILKTSSFAGTDQDRKGSGGNEDKVRHSLSSLETSRPSWQKFI